MPIEFICGLIVGGLTAIPLIELIRIIFLNRGGKHDGK